MQMEVAPFVGHVGQPRRQRAGCCVDRGRRERSKKSDGKKCELEAGIEQLVRVE
jgi:hypothetical protein